MYTELNTLDVSAVNRRARQSLSTEHDDRLDMGPQKPPSPPILGLTIPPDSVFPAAPLGSPRSPFCHFPQLMAFLS